MRGLGVAGVGGHTIAVLSLVLDEPLERVSSEDEDSAIVFAGAIEAIISREYAEGTAAQTRIELIDARCHLDATPFECHAELVVQLYDSPARGGLVSHGTPAVRSAKVKGGMRPARFHSPDTAQSVSFGIALTNLSKPIHRNANCSAYS